MAEDVNYDWREAVQKHSLEKFNENFDKEPSVKKRVEALEERLKRLEENFRAHTPECKLSRIREKF